MKLYRVQAKYKDIYIDKTLEAENDKAALDMFSKKVESGEVIEQESGGWLNPNILFITFEEVDRDATTKIDIGKTSVGVQMGNTGVGTG